MGSQDGSITTNVDNPFFRPNNNLFCYKAKLTISFTLGRICSGF